MRKSSLVLFGLLAGCGSIMAPVKTVYVNVEVAVPCATGEKPAQPANKYGALPAGAGVDYAISALKSDRSAWQKYGTDLSAQTAGCWTPGPAPAAAPQPAAKPAPGYRFQ